LSGNDKREFGDYQTPIWFCEQVCNYLWNSGIVTAPSSVLEPTCGVGHFLQAAFQKFNCNHFFGVEINEEYANLARQTLPSAQIHTHNIFDIDVRKICSGDDVLVLGNPPWATNSNLTNNLPQKLNFKGLRGIDALTGSSNFDICEYIILQLLDRFKYTNSTICMLCKTSVARNVILELSRNHIPYHTLQMLNFDSHKVFNVSAAACVLIIRLSTSFGEDTSVVCNVMDFESLAPVDTLVVKHGVLRSTSIITDLEGKCQLTWRQGVKHDCGKVMELDLVGSTLVNKTKSVVAIEHDLVFPLVKSSHFKKPIINEFSKYVIVTQRNPKQDTSYIECQLPLTWQYLQDHIEQFNGRKSSIYTKAPQFAMFGVGDYSYAPYKVGLSGFYKKPFFSLLHSSKAVMTDDTSYFLPFDDYDTAYCMMLLLNSAPVQRFLSSIAFLDSKRPYTVKLLSRLDLQKCIDYVPFSEIQRTEHELGLTKHVTSMLYEQFSSSIQIIKS